MSLAATYLQDLRAEYPSQLDRYENRVTRAGLLTAALQMTDVPESIVSRNLKEISQVSEGRTLDVPVYKKGSVTINNARSCNIACSQSETDMVTVTWKTISSDICQTPAQYAKNHLSYMEDLNRKVIEMVEAWTIEIENDIDSSLDTAKNQVYNSSLVGLGNKYPLVANALQVASTDQELFFNDVDVINEEDDFYTETLRVIGSPVLRSEVRHYANQGAANDENTAYQFGGFNFNFSNRVTNAQKSTGYFMPNGSIGFLTRTDISARSGFTAGDGTEWRVESLPGLPFNVGLQYKSQCSDQSNIDPESNGDNHLTATMLEKWQFSVDYAIVTPYTSNIATKPTAIRKFEFLP
jgi:hypothetical protein